MQLLAFTSYLSACRWDELISYVAELLKLYFVSIWIALIVQASGQFVHRGYPKISKDIYDIQKHFKYLINVTNGVFSLQLVQIFIPIAIIDFPQFSLESFQFQQTFVFISRLQENNFFRFDLLLQ